MNRFVVHHISLLFYHHTQTSCRLGSPRYLALLPYQTVLELTAECGGEPLTRTSYVPLGFSVFGGMVWAPKHSSGNGVVVVVFKVVAEICEQKGALGRKLPTERMQGGTGPFHEPAQHSTGLCDLCTSTTTAVTLTLTTDRVIFLLPRYLTTHLQFDLG